MAEMVDLVFEELQENIEKNLDNLKRQLAKVRTGRASLSILDDVRADYYGQQTPVRQMANVAIPEPRLIVIQPYDPSFLKDIEKAVVAADLGLNPQNDGKVIRLIIPELTEERRKDLVKQVNRIEEEHRVSLRQDRRDANDTLKKSEKDKEITEDEMHKGMELIQKEVDQAVSEIDKIAEAKKNELMEV